MAAYCTDRVPLGFFDAMLCRPWQRIAQPHGCSPGWRRLWRASAQSTPGSTTCRSPSTCSPPRHGGQPASDANLLTLTADCMQLGRPDALPHKSLVSSQNAYWQDAPHENCKTFFLLQFPRMFLFRLCPVDPMLAHVRERVAVLVIAMLPPTPPLLHTNCVYSRFSGCVRQTRCWHTSGGAWRC